VLRLRNPAAVDQFLKVREIATSQHIAITLAAAPPSDSTLQRFNSVTGASVATVGNGRLKVFAPADLSATETSVPEAGEDVEASSGLAPSATIDFYEVSVDSNGAATTGGVQNALNEAGTDSSNNWQISNSYGIDCELTSTGQPSPVMGAIETIMKTNTATGHDYLFGSGDNGQFCEDQARRVLPVGELVRNERRRHNIFSCC
jgi:subtilase family serine protease